MTGAWDEVVSAALVGTERRRFDPAHLAGLVAPDEVDAEGAEASVLAAAVVLSTWRRAGRRPARAPGPPAPAPPDDRPPASPVAVQVLELLLGGHVSVAGGNAGLLADWLAACASSGRRPPDRLLVPLLRLGTTTPDLRAVVADAVGVRGAWLAERNPEWSWAAIGAGDRGVGDAESRFATAGRAERATLLAAARRADPDRGRALVEATWATETAADRVALLDVLAGALDEGDEAFLEAALDDRAASVRAAAARLLDRLTRSRRAARMAARALPLVRVEGRVRRRLHVDLPAEPDAAARRDGVDDRAPAGVGRRAWWLVQLVGATPLGEWERRLDTAPADAVGLAAGEDALLAGWARAAVARRDRRWAAALAGRRPAPDVVAVLGPDEAAAVVGPALRGGSVPDAALGDVLAACAPPWPEAFSRQVVAHCRATTDRAPSAVRLTLGVLARRLHPGALPAVESWADAGSGGPLGYDLRTVTHALTLRRTIDEELR